MREKLTTLAEAVARVPNGASIAVSGESDMAPMAIVREILRQGKRDLSFIGVPGAGFAAEVLLAAGALRNVEGSNFEVAPFGYAPTFRRLAQAGMSPLLDSG